MEKYIKATEKEIIKEVVLYKDKVIAKAKEITEVAWERRAEMPAGGAKDE